MAILFKRHTSDKESPLCRPAFSSPITALWFTLGMLFLLMTPLILELVAPTNPVKIYKYMPALYYGYHFVGETIEQGGAYDVLIIGASDGATIIDAPVLAERLSEHLGREAHVVNLSANWQGEDRHHQILQDFYRAGGNAKLVLGVENYALQTTPHLLSRYLWRGGHAWISGLPLVTRIQYWMMSVIGLPWQLRIRLLPLAGPTPTAVYQPGIDSLRGWNGYQKQLIGFQSHYTDMPRREAVERTFSVPERDTNFFLFPKEDEGGFEWIYDHTKLFTHFHESTNMLVRKHKGIYATVVPPTHFKDQPHEKVRIRKLFDGKQRDWKIIGIAQSDLFDELSFDEMQNFYTNESHLNYVGAAHFTNVLAPIIIELYDEATRNH